MYQEKTTWIVAKSSHKKLKKCKSANPKDDDPTSTIRPGNYSNSDTSAKNSTINDTLKTPGVEGGAVQNNPDITK